ncbi:uncharacterized protein LOC129301392 [Prosopis cineraria]|uniref:uncharacterized protein LOC129301392 n=1 Tax=Prosopis cineraria TaxID=364024 RepID=UPI00240EA54F|nr:uncharacterized protein LOC129301392 [Prosopis cineraria]
MIVLQSHRLQGFVALRSPAATIQKLKQSIRVCSSPTLSSLFSSPSNSFSPPSACSSSHRWHTPDWTGAFPATESGSPELVLPSLSFRVSQSRIERLCVYQSFLSSSTSTT